MSKLLMVMLLVTSQYAKATTDQEKECLYRNIYHEARGESLEDWNRVAQVALNRKRLFNNKHKFGAKGSDLCSIVKSREYTTRSKLAQPIKEQGVYNRIKESVKVDHLAPTDLLYFSSTKGRLRFKHAAR